MYTERINKYYDEQKKHYSAYSDKLYNVKTYSDDQDNYIIELTDESDKMILKAYCSLIGIYNLSNSVWYWAWNLDLADKKLIEDSKTMKTFPEYITNNFSEFDQKEAEDLYFKTDMGNYYTNDVNNIIKLSMYVMKGLWHINVCSRKNGSLITCKNDNNNNNSVIRYEYYLIKKILQVG